MIQHYKFKLDGTVVTVKPNETDCRKYTVEADSTTWIVSGEKLKEHYTPVNESAEQLIRSIV